MLDRGADGGVVARTRRGAWVLGAILLFVLGLCSVVAPLVGSGGWILFALAVPPLAAGAAAFGRFRAVRVIGPFVALAYAIVAGTVATTSLRGLTPPPGANAPSIDSLLTLLAGAFLVAAILLTVGTPDPPGGRLTRPRRWTLVVLGATIALAGFVLYDLNSSVGIDAYRVVDPNTIVVTVSVAPRSWTRVTEVRETTSEVTVKVESFTFPQLGPETGEMALRELTVPLTESLDDRTVRDANGEAVPRRDAAPPTP